MGLNWTKGLLGGLAGGADTVARQSKDMIQEDLALVRAKRLQEISDASWQKQYDIKREDTLEDRIDTRRYTEGQDTLKHNRAMERSEHTAKMQDKYRKQTAMVGVAPDGTYHNISDNKYGRMGFYEPEFDDQGNPVMDDATGEQRKKFVPLKPYEKPGYYGSSGASSILRSARDGMERIINENYGEIPTPDSPLYERYQYYQKLEEEEIMRQRNPGGLFQPKPERSEIVKQTMKITSVNQIPPHIRAKMKTPGTYNLGGNTVVVDAQGNLTLK
jgi:hypothetical protein